MYYIVLSLYTPTFPLRQPKKIRDREHKEKTPPWKRKQPHQYLTILDVFFHFHNHVSAFISKLLSVHSIQINLHCYNIIVLLKMFF